MNASPDLFAAPVLIDRDTVAALLGVTDRTLSRYAARDDDPLAPCRPASRGRPALYQPREVMEWVLRQEARRQSDAPASLDGDADYDREKARLTRAQADNAELKNAQLRRELARVELLQFAAAEAGSQIAAVLGTVKGRVKRAMPSLSNSALHELEQIVVECQNRAADIQIDWNETPEHDPPLEG